MFLLALWTLGGAVRADEWRVPEATVRFTLRPSRRPTHPEAGFIIFLPDGGILPTPLPAPTVLTRNGAVLDSAVLWQNAEKGLSLVFKDPGTLEPVHVYVAPAQRLNVWRPDMPLKPGPLLFTDPEGDTLQAAYRLANFGPSAARIHVHVAPGHRRAPLNIPGDLTGRPRPAAFYLLAHLHLNPSGETWIAPFTQAGEVETRFNDHRIVPRLRDEKWGGTGQSLTLSAGIQRVEIFAAVPGSGRFDEGQGVMWMTWRTPSDTLEDLGGRRPEGVPYAGTSAWSSRVVREEEIARSGQGALVEVRTRDGRPLAVGSATALENYWTEEGGPVFAYQLSALTRGNPDGTRYRWETGRDVAAEGNPLLWLFPGLREHQVALVTEADGRRSRAVVPFYAYAGVRSSLDREESRRRFQTAFLNMLRAFPAGANPTAGWTEDMWRCFVDVQALNEGGDLLTEVILNRWEPFRQRLRPHQQARMEDLFFHHVSHRDPHAALAWLERTLARTTLRERRSELQLYAAEIALFSLQDPAGASRRLRRLVAEADHPPARIRLGDIAFLQGDLNAAEQLWSQVQSAAARRERDQAASAWQQAAILETRFSMIVISLLEQNRLEEALHELRQWERNFPLAKISGDFILQEARLFMALGNVARARTLLDAYCRNVEASSFLAASAELLLECLLRDPDSDAEIRALAENIMERFRFHPVGQRMETVLRDIEGARRDPLPQP